MLQDLTSDLATMFVGMDVTMMPERVHQLYISCSLPKSAGTEVESELLAFLALRVDCPLQSHLALPFLVLSLLLTTLH
jgi:hypothetical protein